MKNHFAIACFLAFLCLGFSADKKGSVTGNHLNVRTKPSPASEVVCQLQKGDEITVQALEGEWVAIKIPSTCQGWVQAEDVTGDLIRTDGAKVHVAPGSVFASYATMKQGTRVKIIKKKGKWYQVQGELDGSVWVHVDYVELPKGMERPVKVTVPDSTDKTGGRKTGGEVTVVNDGMSVSNPPSVPGKAPSTLEVHEIPNENKSGEVVPLSTAKRVVREGYVVKLSPSKTRPWEYAIAAQINNRYYPLLYIGKSLTSIDKWAYHRVQVTGERQWIRGYPRPVIEVTDIKVVK